MKNQIDSIPSAPPLPTPPTAPPKRIFAAQLVAIAPHVPPASRLVLLDDRVVIRPDAPLTPVAFLAAIGAEHGARLAQRRGITAAYRAIGPGWDATLASDALGKARTLLAVEARTTAAVVVLRAATLAGAIIFAEDAVGDWAYSRAFLAGKVATHVSRPLLGEAAADLNDIDSDFNGVADRRSYFWRQVRRLGKGYRLDPLAGAAL